MKILELSQYLHQLRYTQTKRAIGYRMTAMEIWSLAQLCPKNGINEILVKDADLPAPFDGMFVRLANKSGEGDRAVIFVRRSLALHWKEFVIAKELMHCWSPGESYVTNSSRAKSLVAAFTGKAKKYTALVAGDSMAVVAAAEVMLPLFTLERDFAKEIPLEEIAHRHNLHIEVAEMICSLELIWHRKNGSL